MKTNRRSITRVLHVDDDPAMTRLSASLLGKHDIEVTAIHDPTQALRCIVEGNYRIVIIDLQMPELDGFELLRRIKREDGGIAVIVLTCLVSQATIISSLQEGASACFFKPLNDIRDLVDCIAEIRKSAERWRKTLRQLSQMRKSLVTDGYAAETAEV